jgi:transposase
MAIGHKILRIIYTLLLKKEPYQDSTVDYESLIVQRNAPRWIRALQKFGFLPQVQQGCSAC